MNNKIILIAEAGVNHNGDYNTACKLIDVADAAGVDYVKFQTWITEDLIDSAAPKAEYQMANDSSATQYEMLKKLELSFEQFHKLKEYCRNKKVKFLSTPDDARSLIFLTAELQLSLIKIGSAEVDNLAYLNLVGQHAKQVILSTGMSSIKEVEAAVSTIQKGGCQHISLLHCTSNYPAAHSNINLRAIEHLKNHFKLPIGFSDHSIGNEASIAAVALGATIIEKHFTLDKKMEGPDHAASMNPAELNQWVQQIRTVELALTGSGKKEMLASEIEIKNLVRKGIFVKRELAANSIITFDDLSFKRPCIHISASEYEAVVGRRTVGILAAGVVLKWEDIL